MKMPSVTLTPAEREKAYELWQELKCAVGDKAQEKAQQKLQAASWSVQQAIMHEALAQICEWTPYSKGHNPFGNIKGRDNSR